MDIQKQLRQDQEKAAQSYQKEFEKIYRLIEFYANSLNDAIAVINALTYIISDNDIVTDEELEQYVANAYKKLDNEIEQSKENQVAVQQIEERLKEYKNMHGHIPMS